MIFMYEPNIFHIILLCIFFFEPIEALKIKIISTRILKSKRAHVYNVNNETKFVSIKTL